MAESTILDLASRRTVLLDGALGTELMKRGLAQGACPELMNVEKPWAVRAVHRAYFSSGSDAVSTNSFGGSPLKLAAYGLTERAYELNLAAARIAVEVRPPGRFVGGSIGPSGKLLAPQGEHTEAELAEQFSVQVRGLTDGGVDFLIIETMFDLREAVSALKGARQVTSLPVFVTLTFNRTPRGFFTLMGDGLAKCVHALDVEDVPALGANCTLTSGDLADLAAELRKLTHRPIIIQANAGKAEVSPKGDVAYSQCLGDYVRDIPRIIANGARIVGGCCGTNPAFIRRMAELLGTLRR
jgi:5-methyltetrahydrofolate--homocysteine methyltransferase